jgi:hypothetical protein
LDNSNIITLYHGSIHTFTEIDVARGKPNKDFGRGFYTSRIERHAANIAMRNRKIEQARLLKSPGGIKHRSVAAWVYAYEFDMSELGGLNVKEFADADREWALFVAENRKSDARRNDYDVVIGKTANDDTRTTVDIYIMGGYGDPGSDAAINMFLQLILPDRLPPQMFFGTQRAASLLRFVGRRKV